CVTRMLITWGILATLTGLVNSVPQLYVVRFLLGLAGAGYLPGIALYLTYWVSTTRSGAGNCSVPRGHTCHKHTGRSSFHFYHGSCALAERQRLALAPESGRNSGRNWRCADGFFAAQPPGGG